MAAFPRFTITVVIIERRKPKDWEPPRPPPVISPAQQAKIDALHRNILANQNELRRIMSKK